MEAERTAYARAEACLPRGSSPECERLVADADQVHRDWLARYSALFDRLGNLPPWAMEEQVGAPDALLGNEIGPVWLWQWSTATRNGTVKLGFSRLSNSTMRIAVYCAGADCKSFFAR